MKRILPAILALALGCTYSFAQAPIVRQQSDGQQQTASAEPAHHQRNPDKETAHLSKQLNLTADQTAKLQPILATREQKVAALQANTALAPEDMKKQMHAIRKDTEQQLAGILTPDQLQQMKSMRGHGHGKRTQGQPDAAPPTA